MIIGMTGNTAEHIINKLKKKGVAMLGTSRKKIDSPGIPYVQIERYTEEALRSIFKAYPIEVVIQAANTTLSPLVLKVSQEYSIKHVVLIHTTGIFSKYRSCRLEYEEVESRILGETSAVPVTILRPTLIYGTPKDRNMWRLIQFIGKSPIFPVFGRGNNLFQPVHVDDLAEAVVRCAGNQATYGKQYNISGKTIVSYSEIISLIKKMSFRKVIVIHMPIWLSVAGIWVLNNVFRYKGIIREQVLRMQEDKVFEYREASADFGYQPRSFEEGLKSEIELSQLSPTPSRTKR
ncbi:NAD-dependent epimerase/dehydratase family protein [Cohnella boryungensis]|uniref:NAD-dependent epimerase/dehydratase family protein n=1 Tax=Cohnella boryungensis TaxID=768479 RepID=A0ABV8S7C0_9BACL